MSHQTLAYVNEKRQTFTTLPDGITHKYRLSEKNLKLPSGFYQLQYTIWTQQRRTHEITIYYIDAAEPRTPNNVAMLKRLLSQITGFADRICARFKNDEDIVSVVKRITDESWLKEIKGIGEKTAPKLVESFSSFAPSELQVFSTYLMHGIPYSKGTKRDAWAAAYYAANPKELEAFQQNPYHLYFITDEGKSDVRRLKKLQSDLTPIKYNLDVLDAAVLDHSPSWKDTTQRACAFLDQFITEVFSQGHTICSAQQVIEQFVDAGFETVVDGKEEFYLTARVVEVLAEKTPSIAVTKYNDPESDEIVNGLTTQNTLRQAQTIRRVVHRLLKAKSPYGEEGERALVNNAFDFHSFELDPTQKRATRYAFSHTISAVTGAAGSGKTTTIQSILNGAARLLFSRESRIAAGSPKLKTYSAVNLYVTAPTGKATDRVREGLRLQHPIFDDVIKPEPYDHGAIEEIRFQEKGSFHVCTLHSLLGYRGSHYVLPPPHPSFIVVDEASMTDQEVIYQLMRFVESCLNRDIPVQVLFTGDVEQLPPVAAGYPYRDLLGRGVEGMIPSTTLDTIHRQGQSSAIIWAAKRVLNGKLPPGGHTVLEEDNVASDFYWHQYPRHSFTLYEYAEQVAKRAEKLTDGPPVEPEDVHLMLALRNQSKVESEAFYANKANKDLQEVFAEKRGADLERFVACPDEEMSQSYVKFFGVGDKVIHSGRNNYPGHSQPVMKGAVGHVIEITEDGAVRVAFDQTDAVYGSPEAVHQLSLGYVSTVHWSQGSEFDVTGTVVPKYGAPTLVTRPWLYTSITRASRFADLMATERRLRQAVQNDSTHLRQTLLAMWA